jgi:hypothetical protein
VVPRNRLGLKAISGAGPTRRSTAAASWPRVTVVRDAFSDTTGSRSRPVQSKHRRIAKGPGI